MTIIQHDRPSREHLRRMTRRDLVTLATTGPRQILEPRPETCTKTELVALLAPVPATVGGAA